MSDATPLFGISGLLFVSPVLSSLVFLRSLFTLCLVIFLLMVHSADIFLILR